MNDTATYRNLELVLIQRINGLLDVGALRQVCGNLKIPSGLGNHYNCCWINCILWVLKALCVKLGERQATSLLKRIQRADSEMMSPLDTGDLIVDLGLNVTFVEYSPPHNRGHSIGFPQGPLVIFGNTGSHYNLYLTKGSTLHGIFAGICHPRAERKECAGDAAMARRLAKHWAQQDEQSRKDEEMVKQLVRREQSRKDENEARRLAKHWAQQDEQSRKDGEMARRLARRR